MENQRLERILEWIVEHSGLPFVSCARFPVVEVMFPADKRGKTVQCTVGEVMDIMNDALLPLKYVLIRRDIALALVPSDEKIDARLPRRIKPEDLKRYGRSEIVIVVLPVKGDTAALAAKAKELVSEVAAGPERLLLLDSVRNLQDAIPRIRALKPPPAK